MLVAAYTITGGQFISEKARVWLEKPLGNPRGGRNFDVAPDGKRIIAIVPVEDPDEQKWKNHVVYMENFFDELLRRVPLR
jgi:hypothetical protein